MIFIVGIDRHPVKCIVELTDVENGKNLLPKILKGGNLSSYAERIVDLLLELRPTQIIFDKDGYGIVVKDIFNESIKKRTDCKVFENGEITYL
jgi:hypothetical protein